MQGSPKIFIPLQSLPASLPAGQQWISPFPEGSRGGLYSEIDQISLVGLVGGSLTITMHIVPPGKVPTLSNAYFNAKVVTSNATEDRFYPRSCFVLYPGFSIWAFAGAANTVNLMINGTDYA